MEPLAETAAEEVAAQQITAVLALMEVLEPAVLAATDAAALAEGHQAEVTRLRALAAEVAAVTLRQLLAGLVHKIRYGRRQAIARRRGQAAVVAEAGQRAAQDR